MPRGPYKIRKMDPIVLPRDVPAITKDKIRSGIYDSIK